MSRVTDQLLQSLVLAFRCRHLYKGYARLLQEETTVLIRVIAYVYNPFYTSIDDHLGTGDAGLVCHVDHAARSTHPVERSLNDCVLFGVERTQAVAVYDQMADIVAMGQTGWRTVVPRCQNAAVADDHRTYMRAIAGAASGYGKSNLKEVIVPGWAIGLRRGHAQR